MEDRRARIRYKVERPVKMKTSKGITKGITKDMSVGGAFISCEQPLSPGQSFQLTVEFPHSSFAEVPVQVIWSTVENPDDEASLPGMGVRFLW